MRSKDLQGMRAEIAKLLELGGLAGAELLARWRSVLDGALLDTKAEWLEEPAFRARTGASPGWCQRNYEAYRGIGLARQRSRHRREWHILARPPKGSPGKGEEGLRSSVLSSFDGAAA